MAGCNQFKFSHIPHSSIPIVYLIFSIQFFCVYVNRNTRRCSYWEKQLEVVLVVVLIVSLVVVLVVLVILIILTVLAVLVVLRIVCTIVKLVVVEVLIVVRHFKFLLLIFSYRSSMAKSHKKYVQSRTVLWYYYGIDFVLPKYYNDLVNR